MPIKHAVDLFRSNKEARGGLGFAVLLVVIMMGWMAIAYGRLNLYLILVSFPMFNAIIIFLILIILIRAENMNLQKLNTIPGGIRKTLIGHAIVAITIGLILNTLFEIMTFLLRDFLVETIAQTLPAIDYTPNILTLFLFIACNLSFYVCFTGFAIWVFSQSKIAITSRSEELAKLEGFVSPRFFLVIILIVIGSVLLGLIIQTVITSTQGDSLLDPAVVAMVSLAFNVILSIIMWNDSWKSIG